MTRNFIAALLACSVFDPSAFAGSSDVSKPCASPDHRRFDFWIGDWDVKNASGEIVGRNRISAIQDACALQEQWEGRGGSRGTSLNVYDATRKVWHQTWVDNQGGLLVLEGRWREGAMRLQGRTRNSDTGRTELQRITWTPQPDGRVRQLWESSEEGGATWKVVFDGWYAKRG